MIFVFGSNEAGRHGAGAALTARRDFGAQLGVGYGHTGNSFAGPTLDGNLKPLSYAKLNGYVAGFLIYAHENPSMHFKVTRIGCGLAGLQDRVMAPMFREAPKNCCFDTFWTPWLGAHAKYWGTF